MSSNNFQEFLEQLHATGHLKADGYDLSLFHKLSTSELHQAEELLIEALSRGDWNGVDALCIIGNSKAIQALEELFPKIGDSRFLKFKLAVYLLDKTGNADYKAYMTPNFNSFNDTDRLSYVRNIPLLNNAGSYLDTLFSIALNDSYSVVRFYAGVSTLRIMHFIDTEEKIENYRPVLIQLADNDLKRRIHGIEDLKNVLAANSH